MFNYNVSYFELETDFDPNDQNNVSVIYNNLLFSFLKNQQNILLIKDQFNYFFHLLPNIRKVILQFR